MSDIKELPEEGTSFTDCNSLKQIKLPDAAYELKCIFFINCEQLENIALPRNVESIRYCLFRDTSLKELVFPPHLRELRGESFDGCPLERIEMLGPYVPGINFREAGIDTSKLFLRADHTSVELFPDYLQKCILADYLDRIAKQESVPQHVEKACLDLIYRKRREFWSEPIYQPVILEHAMISAEEYPWFLKQIKTMEKEGDPQHAKDLRKRLKQYMVSHGLQEEMDRLKEEKNQRRLTQPTQDTVDTAELRTIWKTKPWNEESQYISSYTGQEIHVTVPAIIGRKPVVSIGPCTFCSDTRFFKGSDDVRRSRLNIRTIQFEEGVKELADCSISYVPRLESVILPESLRLIGDKAFVGCGKLTVLTIPEHVVWVGPGFLDGCYDLKELIILGAQTVLSEYQEKKFLSRSILVKASTGSPASYWAKENGLQFIPLN